MDIRITSLTSSLSSRPPKMVTTFESHEVAYEDGKKSIHYLAAGPTQGPLLIFLHGWPGIAKTWKFQLSTFASLGFRVVAPDLPGHGKSTANKVVEDYAQKTIMPGLVAMLADVGRDHAIWVAHDWGCGVLGTLCATHPHLLKGAIFLAVPYRILELGLEEIMKYAVNREIYPEERYPHAQWSYQFFYEKEFDKVTAWDDSNPEGLMKILYSKVDPGTYLKPARTADVERDGSWFGGIPKPPPAASVPWEATNVDEEMLAELTEAFTNTGFFGTNAYYMNHKSNREYNTKQAVNNGVLNFPVLFIEAKWDAVCATSSTQACEPQRSHCKKLTETVVEAGHWLQMEKPAEVNAAISRWLVEELTEFWPGFWTAPHAKRSVV